MAKYIEPTEDELDRMTDEEAETAFLEAKAAQAEVAEEPESIEEDTETLEQPELDSDDDVADEELVEEADNEDSEVEDPTGEDTEEKIEEEANDTKEPEAKVETRRLKARANGQDVEFTQDEVNNLFPNMYSKASDYTQKMQALKPFRNRIDAMQEENVSDTDFSLMMDVLKGDKTAIDEILKRTGVNALELGDEEASDYIPKNYGRDEKQIAIDDIVGSIDKDPEYSITQKVISEQWDDSSKSMLVDNPEMINLLHTDVKSGMYDKVAPLAEKRKMSDMISGRPQKSDLDYYKEVGGEYYQIMQQEKVAAEQVRVQEASELAEKNKIAEVKAATTKRNTTKSSTEKRKAAATTSNATKKTVTDYLDDDDESYDAWYKALQDRT